jgi:steroid 5-alpha reductase family enzyme
VTILTAIFVGLGAAILVMTVLWAFVGRKGTAGLVDVAWTFLTGLIAILFAVAADGDATRRILVGAMAGLWALRLGLYLAARLRRESEDGRYEMMKRKWGSRAPALFFGFFMLQASWAVLFAFPMLAAAQNGTSPLGVLDGIGVLLWLTGMTGVFVADRQLERFRADPANRGKVCRTGLWSWSRHPNYFFEWVHWCAWIPLAAGGPWLPVAATGAAVMYLFLTRVTGIPPSEARAIESRGDAYREYQRTTSAFFPRRPREGVTS